MEEDDDKEPSDTTLLVSNRVTSNDIARVVAKMTGIPVSNLIKGERERLLTMESELRKRVVGQDEALERIADSVRLTRAGLNHPTRPIASFLFLGPTGVGKTELCKALAGFLFDTQRALIQIKYVHNTLPPIPKPFCPRLINDTLKIVPQLLHG